MILCLSTIYPHTTPVESFFVIVQRKLKSINHPYKIDELLNLFYAIRAIFTKISTCPLLNTSASYYQFTRDKNPQKTIASVRVSDLSQQ